MFRFAQFATGRIRRGGHDSISYEMLSTWRDCLTPKALRAKFEQAWSLS